MPTSSKAAKSDLTVLVFKDNSAARTFRVPTQWISRLGLLVGTVSAVACLGVFLSLKYYLAARQALRIADPAYVQDLEAEVASLRNAAGSNDHAQTSSTASTANPIPTVTVTVTPPASSEASSSEQTAPAPVAAVAPITNVAFSAVPASVIALPASEVPIDIYEPHVSWLSRTLKVQFFIHYARDDKGNQQGRIILLARGPDTVLAYPAGVLNTDQSQALIAPEKGEYFSVSRIREVKADFGPMKSRSALRDVEVFLFNTDGKLLVHQTLVPTAPIVDQPADQPADQSGDQSTQQPASQPTDQPATSPENGSGASDSGNSAQ